MFVKAKHNGELGASILKCRRKRDLLWALFYDISHVFISPLSCRNEGSTVSLKIQEKVRNRSSGTCLRTNSNKGKSHDLNPHLSVSRPTLFPPRGEVGAPKLSSPPIFIVGQLRAHGRGASSWNSPPHTCTHHTHSFCVAGISYKGPRFLKEK